MGGKGSGNRNGNRIPVKDRPNHNTTGLVKANNDLQDMTEHYKEIARSRANVVKYDQPYISGAADRINAYIEEKRTIHEPLTMAGLQLAGEIPPDAWSRAVNGEYDHLLYQYMELHDIPFEQEGTIYTDPETGEMILLIRASNVLKRFNLIVQEERERRTSSTKGNPAGNIFLLKGFHGIYDQPDQATIYSDKTLVIADSSKAREMLEMLKPSNSNG